MALPSATLLLRAILIVIVFVVGVVAVAIIVALLFSFAFASILCVFIYTRICLVRAIVAAIGLFAALCSVSTYSIAL